ncbi:hypothetical protein ACQPZX_42720 [Actinoplanes sp. CA-142083]|uniref:hypothetical protein n=1 Tax=Actinoplanes sp. CA-142083 TaxID=3239903 RepID=UPI003D8B4713
MTAGGPSERMTAVVTAEQADAFPAHVRLELATPRGIPSGAPMTPDEALRLSRLLKLAARRAVSR